MATIMAFVWGIVYFFHRIYTKSNQIVLLWGRKNSMWGQPCIADWLLISILIINAVRTLVWLPVSLASIGLFSSRHDGHFPNQTLKTWLILSHNWDDKWNEKYLVKLEISLLVHGLLHNTLEVSWTGVTTIMRTSAIERVLSVCYQIVPV